MMREEWFSRRAMFGGVQPGDPEKLAELKDSMVHLRGRPTASMKTQTLDTQIEDHILALQREIDYLEYQKARRGWLNEGWWIFYLMIFCSSAFLAAGIGINWQNWTCGTFCGPRTGGRGDKTPFTTITGFVLGVFNLQIAGVFYASYRPFFAVGYFLKGVAWVADIMPPVLWQLQMQEEGFNPDDVDRYTYPMSQIIIGIGQIAILGGIVRSLKLEFCLCCGPLLVAACFFGVYATIVFLLGTGIIHGIESWVVSTVFEVMFMAMQFFVSSLFLLTRDPNPRRLAPRQTCLSCCGCEQYFSSHKASLPFYLISIFLILFFGFSRPEPWISNPTFNDEALFRTICMFAGAMLFWVIHDIRDYQTSETDYGTPQEEEKDWLMTSVNSFSRDSMMSRGA